MFKEISNFILQMTATLFECKISQIPGVFDKSWRKQKVLQKKFIYFELKKKKNLLLQSL